MPPVYSSGASFRSRARVGEVLRLGGDLAQALEVGVADDGRDQPLLDRHRHGDVDLVPVPDVVVLPPGVAFGMLPQGGGHGLEDDVVERHLLAAAGQQRLARLGRALHVHLGGEVERGDRADGLDQPLRDRLSDLGERDVLVGLALGYPHRRRCTGGRLRGRGRAAAFDVPGDHATFRARAGHRRQVDPALRRHPARERRCLDPTGGRRGLGGRRPGRRGRLAVAFQRRARLGRGWHRGGPVPVGRRLGSLLLAGVRLRRGLPRRPARRRTCRLRPPSLPARRSPRPAPTPAPCVPADTTCLSSVPPARATSSITALSVSTSASTSPTATASPSFFFHSTSRPSSIVGDSASITTLVLMPRIPGTGPGSPPRRSSRRPPSRRAPGACCRASGRRRR